MKYLKTYENIKNKLKIGDYVLLDIKYFLNTDGLARIINDVEDGPFQYIIIFPDNDFSFISADKIIRKLTPEEIEEFEAKKAANKYNL